MKYQRILHGFSVTFGAPAPTLDQSPDPPLLGLARVCSPPPVNSPERPLLVDVATCHRRAGSTRCTSRSAHVDSHHLDGFLRSGGPSILQPDPDGVRYVSRHLSSFSRCADPKIFAPSARANSAVPRNAVHTLRSIPLIDSRTASLRPLPSCRCCPPPLTHRTEVRRARCGS
jgi:hypothetical protein